MSTRREIHERIAAPLTPLYGRREAVWIAYIAASGLSGVPVSALMTDPGVEMAIEGLDGVIAQLAAGRPIQYVLGKTEFCGLQFSVREGVLIPRPETEELVEWVSNRESDAHKLLDVGTGSGCIAIALQRLLPGATVFAADISDEALAIASENARRLEAPVVFRKADALSNLPEMFPERFDAIVSNPPYVPAADRQAMHANVRDYEPSLALFVPDDDPLLFYRAIARAGRQMLRPSGRLYFEIYEHSAEAMQQMLREEGYEGIELREDINAKPRMVCSSLK